MPPALATFVFELVNFLALAGLLGWLLFKPVRAMLQARQAAEKQQADQLAARAADADRVHAEWLQRTASFDAEMTDARAQRLAAADQQAATIVARAREVAAQERDRAVRTLAHVEQAQLEKLAVAVASTAREAVGRFLTAIESPDLDASLLRAACRRLESIGAGALGTVLVESARPLDERERSAIATALGTRAASTAFQVVPDLGVGLRVSTGLGLIDASAAGIAAAAERRLKDALAAEEQAVSHE